MSVELCFPCCPGNGVPPCARGTRSAACRPFLQARLTGLSPHAAHVALWGEVTDAFPRFLFLILRVILPFLTSRNSVAFFSISQSSLAAPA